MEYTQEQAVIELVARGLYTSRIKEITADVPTWDELTEDDDKPDFSNKNYWMAIAKESIKLVNAYSSDSIEQIKKSVNRIIKEVDNQNRTTIDILMFDGCEPAKGSMPHTGQILGFHIYDRMNDLRRVIGIEPQNYPESEHDAKIRKERENL